MEVYVTPPVESYPEGGIVRKLRQAMYGLKAAPKAWQLHQTHVGTRSQATMDRAESLLLRVGKTLSMSYIDDILAVGPHESTDCFYREVPQLRLVN